MEQGGGSPSKGPRSGVDGPHDSADSSTGLFRSRSLLPSPSDEPPRQLGFSEAWRMVRPDIGTYFVTLKTVLHAAHHWMALL